MPVLAKTNRNVSNLVILTTEEKSYIQANRPLMTYDPSWPPFDFRNNNGRHSGIISDILRLITNKTGLRIAPVHTDSWSETMDLVKQGRFDIVSMLNQSDERKVYLNFTTPIMTNPLIIVARSDNENITDLQSITGPVAVVDSYLTEQRVLQSKPDAVLLKARSTEDTLEMVNDGQAQVTVLTEVEAKHFIRDKKWKQLKITGSTPYSNILRIGVRKDDKILLSILQKGVNAITISERDKIIHKWLAYHDHMDDDPLVDWKVLILAIISLAVSIIVIRKSGSMGKK
jgi:ABC-type amino acid transport substrate-binding protein